MADPVITATPKDVWTKVATNKTTGFVHIHKKSASYLQTYRLTGGAVPAAGDPAEGVEMLEPGAEIKSSAGIDVYIMALSVDGVVRVDV